MLKSNTRTLPKNYNHNIKNLYKNLRLLKSNPLKPTTRSSMNKESSVVTPIGKQIPSVLEKTRKGKCKNY